MILKLITEAFLSYVATICFGILMNIPLNAYNLAGLIGAGSWVIYCLLYFHIHIGLALSNLLAAVLISILSMVAARRCRQPMIVFNVPALVTFVPGGQAYRMVRNFVLGNNNQAFVFLYQVIVIAGAITLGFGIGEMINHALFRRKKLQGFSKRL
ncbi:threonine/serine exporter family protein [Limosilactobacillus difficilis]|uniref:threonine/serine exporter family protein n=1 Tax=Limosilactobacillus difficilis TaxID=2991838 RepID=UPI0024B8D180|nr:threonine/serine exporter family protein [Limosilactobacillus difficilis]